MGGMGNPSQVPFIFQDGGNKPERAKLNWCVILKREWRVGRRNVVDEELQGLQLSSGSSRVLE